MGEALKRLKDIKGHPTMVQDMVEKYCCNSSKDECIQRTCEDCQFDDVYSQFTVREIQVGKTVQLPLTRK